MSYAVTALPEFLAAISASAGAERALHNGIEQIAETFEAEVVAVVDEGEVIASTGLFADGRSLGDVLAVADERTRSFELPGHGLVEATALALKERAGVLVIARANRPLTKDEGTHAQVMARILALAMNLVDQLDENQRLAAEQQRLLDEHRAYHAVQDAILRVQRLISQRQPIQTILEAISAEAVMLLRSDLAGICVYTPLGPTLRHLAEGTDTGRRLAAALSERELLLIGKQATSGSVKQPTTLTIETEDGEAMEATLVGSPVFEGTTLIGGLFVLSATGPDMANEAGVAPLETFASQASIALADASTINELEHAFHDHLTGLPNRSLFHDRLDHALELGARTGKTTGLLFIDLDRFKRVNDTLGHAAGDALLQEVASALRSAGRASDSVARVGGDEFAVVLEDTSAAVAERVAHRLLERVAKLVAGSGEHRPGFSIGIAVSGPDCHTTDELLRRADIAMYAVKTSGGDGVALYEESMGERRLDQNAVTDSLQTALDQDDFVVHYQPILSLQNRQIIGVEALVRWRDPERGLVPPAAFIHAAERTGMIVPIGRRVLQTACRQVAEWRRTIPNAADLSVNVNLSVRQLEDESIRDDVANALAAADLDPTALTLEVTESVFVNDPVTAGARLGALKDLGIQLAIDDFGTGFSSLSYIHNYPFDVLKIDRSFIKDIGSSTNSGAVTRTLLTLAKQLSMTAVAEGIESQGELAQLRALRCTHGQGFLFSRPVDAEQLLPLLTAGTCATHPVPAT